MSRRDTKIYIIKTTPQQDAAAYEALLNMDAFGPVLDMSIILADNCSVCVNRALDAAGIGQTNIPHVPGTASIRTVSDPGYVGEP